MEDEYTDWHERVDMRSDLFKPYFARCRVTMLSCRRKGKIRGRVEPVEKCQGYVKRSMEADDDINSIAEKLHKQDWGESQSHQHESRNARFKLTKGMPYL
jgi:hypothetical protein